MIVWRWRVVGLVFLVLSRAAKVQKFWKRKLARLGILATSDPRLQATYSHTTNPSPKLPIATKMSSENAGPGNTTAGPPKPHAYVPGKGGHGKIPYAQHVPRIHPPRY